LTEAIEKEREQARHVEHVTLETLRQQELEAASADALCTRASALNERAREGQQRAAQAALAEDPELARDIAASKQRALLLAQQLVTTQE